MHKRISRTVFVILGFFISFHISAQKLNLGVKFQKTHTLYWENGITAQYSFENLRPDQFFIGLEILSSRLGSAINSNALKQDSYIGSLSYYLRNKKDFQIKTKMNIGFFNVQLRDERFKELPKSDLLLSPEIGVRYNLKNEAIVVDLGAGFNVGLKGGGESPGTLQPLFYNFTVYYAFYKNNSNDQVK